MFKKIIFEKLYSVKVAVRIRVEIIVNYARVKILRRTVLLLRNIIISFKR